MPSVHDSVVFANVQHCITLVLTDRELFLLFTLKYGVWFHLFFPPVGAFHLLG